MIAFAFSLDSANPRFTSKTSNRSFGSFIAFSILIQNTIINFLLSSHIRSEGPDPVAGITHILFHVPQNYLSPKY